LKEEGEEKGKKKGVIKAPQRRRGDRVQSGIKSNGSRERKGVRGKKSRMGEAKVIFLLQLAASCQVLKSRCPGHSRQDQTCAVGNGLCNRNLAFSGRRERSSSKEHRIYASPSGADRGTTAARKERTTPE